MIRSALVEAVAVVGVAEVVVRWQRWQQAPERAVGVVNVVLLLGRGWKGLWRPGNDAGSRPRIAEGAARDDGRSWEGLSLQVDVGLMGQGWLGASDAGSD